MYKRPDSDIFGTKQLQQHPQITNDSSLDPNQAFKRKNDQNYSQYFQKIGNVGRKNVDGNPEMTKVNQKVSFDEEFHKSRKYQDMQSSIFYQPRQYTRPQTSDQKRPLKQKQISNNQAHYGRKNTMKRQIDSLPFNRSNIKGNTSQLFDFDGKNQQISTKKNQFILIPHQMQWDQHDSIRYQHNKQTNHQNPINFNQKTIQKVQQTKSTQDPNQKIDRKQELKNVNDIKVNEQTKTKVQTKNIKNSNQSKLNDKTKKIPIKQDNKQKIVKQLGEYVQINILKGWDNKFMEGLTKFCLLYGTPIMKFEFESEGKAVIHLKRTKKWEVITDWLTKEAKLRIKVLNN